MVVPFDESMIEAFLAHVPQDGSSIGNTILLKLLGWDKQVYDAVKASLIESGRLKLGPGYGGSVRRVTENLDEGRGMGVSPMRPTGVSPVAARQHRGLHGRDGRATHGQDARATAKAESAERALDKEIRQFLKHMPQDGSTIGNKRLRERLGWSVEEYQRVKERLVADGTVAVGRGYGGTVSLTGKPKRGVEGKKGQAKGKAKGKVKRPWPAEKELYDPFLRGLELWMRDQGWDSHFAEQIAYAGGKKTGGSWTRPDFVVVGTRRYICTPGVVRDVETFEIKLPNCGIAAVFETAAHSRFATKSYLAVLRSKKADAPNEQDLARIESECQRFGIGLVLFENPANVDSWEYRVEPERGEPDPQHLEDFVRTQLPKRRQEEFHKMML